MKARSRRDTTGTKARASRRPPAPGTSTTIPATQPCKFVALHANTAVQGEERGVEQLEFEEVDESMKKMYAEECAKNGVKVDMD